jgi:hypothetical protein
MKPKVLINLGLAIVLTLLVWSAVAPAGALAQDPDPINGEANGSNGDDEDDAANGAYIELRVQPALGEAWTVVQWQDSMGRWQDVDGWRAQVEPGQAVNWWVAPKHLDTGPYRWLVYQGEDRRAVVWASELFYLPKQGETLVVTTAASVRPGPDHPGVKPMMAPEGRPHDSVMPEKGRQPSAHMPEKESQPDTLMPETGTNVGGTPKLVTTAFSALAALALLAGGLVAAFRKGFAI